MTRIEMTMLEEVVDAKIKTLKRNIEIASTIERKENLKGRLAAYREIKTMMTDSETLDYLWQIFVGE